MAAPLKAACVRTFGKSNALLSKSKQYAICPLSVALSSNKSNAHKNQTDFFGIAEDENHTGADGYTEPCVADDKEMQKLIRPLLRRKDKKMEVVMQTSYGQIRLDNSATKPFLGDVKPEQFMQAVVNPDKSIEEIAGRQKSKSNGEQDSKLEKSSQSKDRKSNRNTKRDSRLSENSQEYRSRASLQSTANQENSYFYNIDHRSQRVSAEAKPLSSQAGVNFFDEQYFPNVSANERFSDEAAGYQRAPSDGRRSSRQIQVQEQIKPDITDSEGNIFDQQYFDIGTRDSTSSRPFTSPESEDVGNARDGKFQRPFVNNQMSTQNVERNVDAQKAETGSAQEVPQETNTSYNKGGSFFDEVYFPTLTSTSSNSNVDSQSKDAKSSFIDEQYFPLHLDDSSSTHQEISNIKSLARSGEENFYDSLLAQPVPSNVDGESTIRHNVQKSQARNATDTRKQKLSQSESERRGAEQEASSNRTIPTDEGFSFSGADIESQYFSRNQSSFNAQSPPFDSLVRDYGVAGNEVEGFVQPPRDPPLETRQRKSDANDRRSKFSQNASSMSQQFGEDFMSHTAKSSLRQDHEMSQKREHLTIDDDRRSSSLTNETKTRSRQTNPRDFNAFDEDNLSEERPTEPLERKTRGRERKVSTTREAMQSADQQTNAAGKTELDEDSAYNVAMQMRKNLRHNFKPEESPEDLPSDKVKVLRYKDQVPDLHRMPSADVAKLLADSVIYENDDFIAVNKPYGLPSHGGPGVRTSVGQVLDLLARRVDKGRCEFDGLHLIHRLDKETTGVMLLAKNAEVAWQLLGMFRRREVTKVYWTLTKGVPKPPEGVIDIPLVRQEVNGVYKTIVRPKEYLKDEKIKASRDERSKEAVTKYTVLASTDSMALVECCPLTGVQHQIRAHLAQALNTPVLGDHKYSHTDRLAPQRLFPEALQKLGIRQAQVRYLPMHLHAKQLVLPEWRGKHNVFIKANIPKFFLQNLKTLRIKIPSK